MIALERDFILCAPSSWSLFFRTITPNERSTLEWFMYGGTKKKTLGSVKTAQLCAWKGTPTLHNEKLAVCSVKVTLKEDVI